MVKKLSEPSKELATKLLSKVSFEKRLIGIKMRPMAGDMRYGLYNLQEVADFLHIDELENLLMRGGGSYIGYIDLNSLKVWIEEVLGDKELADAIGEEIKKPGSYKKHLEPVKDLIRQRLKQCRAVLKEI